MDINVFKNKLYIFVYINYAPNCLNLYILLGIIIYIGRLHIFNYIILSTYFDNL